MNRVKRIFLFLIRPWRWYSVAKSRFLNSSKWKVFALYRYHMNRYERHVIKRVDNPQSLEARIIMAYHVIEKGLTMPNRHLRFGQQAMLELITLIKEYAAKYGKLTQQVQHAIGVVKAYDELHKMANAKLDARLLECIQDILEQYPSVAAVSQHHQTSDEFYKDKDSAFPLFAKARHTLRFYSGKVSREDIVRAIDLAKTAPSACNRQYVHVYCVEGRDAVQSVLSLQNGNRGFGQYAEQLLVITGNLHSVCWLEECNDVYTNCGMFAMNLCYSLFYYKVSNCVLNWSTTAENDARLHEILDIPDNEVIALLVLCGQTPQLVDVADSPRRDAGEILTFR